MCKTLLDKNYIGQKDGRQMKINIRRR